jgi:hypothetical protein
MKELFIVVSDVDLGVAVYGVYTTRERAGEAIEEFCSAYKARFAALGIEASKDPKRFYLLTAATNAPMTELDSQPRY